MKLASGKDWRGGDIVATPDCVIDFSNALSPSYSEERVVVHPRLWDCCSSISTSLTCYDVVISNEMQCLVCVGSICDAYYYSIHVCIF
jgi:hypothetical protein